jgi:hypothetical protein
VVLPPTVPVMVGGTAGSWLMTLVPELTAGVGLAVERSLSVKFAVEDELGGRLSG